METSTLYTILMIEQDASLERVKKACRKIQLENHPGKTKGLPEVQRFACENLSKAANVAHEVLSNPKLRSVYDDSIGPKSYHAPQTQPQQPYASQTSPPRGDHEPRPDIDTRNPPYIPSCRPGKFPNKLHITGLFSFRIRLEGAYEPYDRGATNGLRRSG